ncbi:hypothetical protein [Methylobacter sp.]|uniref:hypothetical protein n=1 Tax=Methylobacter sp. TaxID=2051955 RepID=UPI003DA25ED1
MKLAKILSAIALILSLPVQAESTSTGAVLFNGTDGNWFNPANWSAGRVPGAEDDVVLDADDNVVIDPALGRMPVQVRDLTVRGKARLETLPDTHLITRDEIVQDQGQLIHRSSASEGDTLIISATSDPAAGFGFAQSGTLLNPSTQSHRDVILKTRATLQFGLGGLEPASLTTGADGSVRVQNGAGHYATLTADLVVLNSSQDLTGRIGQLPPGLLLSLHYGFRPADGDSFQIITANRRLVDQFRGLPEGALAGCTDDNVGLYISYMGGDGNDVVLAAKDTSPEACLLLPAIQKVREAAAR